MALKFLKTIGIVILSLAVFLTSFYATTVAHCLLNPQFDRVLWVKIEPPDD